MNITLNDIPDCQCSGGCFISPGDKACAEAWGVTEREAHRVNLSALDLISEAVLGARVRHVGVDTPGSVM